MIEAKVISGNIQGVDLQSASPSDGNVVSASGDSGIWVSNPHAAIQSKIIGLGATGEVLANGQRGIFVDSGSTAQIGGIGAGNVISGNPTGLLAREA